jgi:pimeloyl-[acyl-carrier protein] methyl ester esterase
MIGAPGLVFVSGWSAGRGAWNGVLAALPPLPVAHLDWWTALTDPAAAFVRAAAEANACAGRPAEAPVIAVGWSLGGQIAARAAIDAPQAISDLLLISTPARLLADETGLGADPVSLRAMRQGLRRDAQAIVEAFWAEALAGDRTGFDFAGEKHSFLADLDARTLDAGLAALAETDLRRHLPRIAAATLVIQGDDDRIVGAQAAQAFVRGVPGATVLAVADGSHALPLTHPRMVAEIVAALVGTHTGEACR